MHVSKDSQDCSKCSEKVASVKKITWRRYALSRTPSIILLFRHGVYIVMKKETQFDLSIFRRGAYTTVFYYIRKYASALCCSGCGTFCHRGSTQGAFVRQGSFGRNHRLISNNMSEVLTKLYMHHSFSAAIQPTKP